MPSGPCLCGLCFRGGPPRPRFCVIVTPPIGRTHNEQVCPLYGVLLRSSPLAGASMSLPNPHPLAVASDDVGLISINGVGATAATHHILDCRNVSGLDEVVAATAVEAIH